MIHERDRQLDWVAQEAVWVPGIESAVIFVVLPGTDTLRLVAAAGIEGPPLEGLVAAVQDPAHPVARALGDDGPSFDVYPVNPGGSTLRSHLPFGGDTGANVGVLAIAHDISLDDAQRRQMILLAERAARHV
jgi:hypothetical protein